MTLGAAVMVLVFALIGIVSAHRYLRKNRTVYIFCRVLLALLALTCAHLYWADADLCRCGQKQAAGAIRKTSSKRQPERRICEEDRRKELGSWRLISSLSRR